MAMANQISENAYLRLCDGWALGYDKNQWIVLRAKKRGDEPYWNAVGYIASTKTFLCRYLREKGVQISDEAQQVIDTMPERFLDWIAGTASVPSDGGAI